MKKKRMFAIVFIVLALWLLLFITDFYTVTRFERPLFCLLTEACQDGGSGRYQGLGYSFAIEGNFMPEDEYPGVTRYHAKLFGIAIKSGIRD